MTGFPEVLREWRKRRRVSQLELATYLPERPVQPPKGHLGFAIPLQLRTDDVELRLISSLTHFGTAVDVTVAELRLEAFLPADRKTSEFLRMR